MTVVYECGRPPGIFQVSHVGARLKAWVRSGLFMSQIRGIVHGPGFMVCCTSYRGVARMANAYGWGEKRQWRFARKPSDESLLSIVKFRGRETRPWGASRPSK